MNETDLLERLSLDADFISATMSLYRSFGENRDRTVFIGTI